MHGPPLRHEVFQHRQRGSPAPALDRDAVAYDLEATEAANLESRPSRPGRRQGLQTGSGSVEAGLGRASHPGSSRTSRARARNVLQAVDTAHAEHGLNGSHLRGHPPTRAPGAFASASFPHWLAPPEVLPRLAEGAPNIRADRDSHQPREIVNHVTASVRSHTSRASVFSHVNNVPRPARPHRLPVVERQNAHAVQGDS